METAKELPATTLTTELELGSAQVPGRVHAFPGTFVIPRREEVLFDLRVTGGDLPHETLASPDPNVAAETWVAVANRWLSLKTENLFKLTEQTIGIFQQIGTPVSLELFLSSIREFEGTPARYEYFLKDSLRSEFLAIRPAAIAPLTPHLEKFVQSSLVFCFDGLSRTDLLDKDISREAVIGFVSALISTFGDVPAGEQLPSWFAVNLDRHLLPVHITTAHEALSWMARDAEGLRHFFGRSASRSVNGLSDYRVTVANKTSEQRYCVGFLRGEHEGQTGIQLAFWNFDAVSPDVIPLAKLHLSFSGTHMARVANIQGLSVGHCVDQLRANREYEAHGYPRVPPTWLDTFGKIKFDATQPHSLEPRRHAFLNSHKAAARETFGIKSELDGVLLLAIAVLKELGYSELQGIDDSDQQAFLDSRKLGAGGKVYGPRFARFGFAAPTDACRFWSLNLRSLEPRALGSASETSELVAYASAVRARRIPGDQSHHSSWDHPRAASPIDLEKLLANILGPAEELAQQIRAAR